MPSRTVKTHLEDILISIAKVEDFIGEADFALYTTDDKTKSSVERQLQIVTEAACRLGDGAEIIGPGIDWKGYRGFGNLLRHSYHTLRDDLVWTFVKSQLPELKAAVTAAPAKLPPDSEERASHE